MLAVIIHKGVEIFDHLGNLKYHCRLHTTALKLCWNLEGTVLMVIEKNSVMNWSESTGRSIIPVDVDLLGIVSWNRQYCAIATNDGNLMILNALDNKMMSLATNCKQITSLVWTSVNEIAVSSIEGSITVITLKGQIIKLVQLNIPIANLKFRNKTLGGIGNNQSIHLLMGKSLENRVDLQANSKHGLIVDYFILDDEILVATEKGYILILSISPETIGKLVLGTRILKNGLKMIDYCSYLNKIVLAGEDIVKIVDLQDAQVYLLIRILLKLIQKFGWQNLQVGAGF